MPCGGAEEDVGGHNVAVGEDCGEGVDCVVLRYDVCHSGAESRWELGFEA